MANAEMNDTSGGRGDVIRADTRHRRLTTVTMVAVATVALLLLWGLQSQMQQIGALAETNLPDAVSQMILMVRMVAGFGALGALIAGVWFWRIGSRTRRSGQYPPPGTKVLRDTPVRTGAKAIRMANLAQLTAGSLVIVMSLAMWYLVRVAESLLRQ